MKGSSSSSYFLTRKVNEKPVNTGLLADIRRVGMPQRIEKIYSLFVVSEEEKVSKPIFDRSLDEIKMLPSWEYLRESIVNDE